jgi:hypothetical protein
MTKRSILLCAALLVLLCAALALLALLALLAAAIGHTALLAGASLAALLALLAGAISLPALLLAALIIIPIRHRRLLLLCNWSECACSARHGNAVPFSAVPHLGCADRLARPSAIVEQVRREE